MDLSVEIGVFDAAAVVVLVAVAVLGARLAVRRGERMLGRTLASASSIVSMGLAADTTRAALDEVTARLARLFDADTCSVAVPTGDGRLAVAASYGYPNPEQLLIGETEGMVGKAFTTGQPVVAPDVGKEPAYLASVPGIKSAVAVPLRYQGRIIGAFDIESRTRTFSQRDLLTMLPLADQIAAVVANHRLRRDLEARAASEAKARIELQAITSVVMAGVSGEDLDSALRSMVSEIARHTGWGSMAVILFGEDGLLRTRAYYGYPEFSTKITWEPHQGVVGTVAATGVGRRIDDVRTDPDYWDIVGDTRSEMCAPLKLGDRILGVLNAESPELAAFSEDDFRLLNMLADQMAIVVERARLADLERESLRRLRELDQLKDDFIATVSHELRTPLTSINGYAQTMLARGDELTDEERKTFLQAISRQCERLSSMVESLLLVSRIEAGELEPRPSYVLVRDLLREAIDASGDPSRVEIDIDDTQGIVTDHFRIHHIVRNLVENACKYSPRTQPVLVRVRGEDVVDGVASRLRIEVLDRGRGIPAEEREAAFDRFRRLGGPGRGVPGTGLGLFISRRFARDLGGDVSFEEPEPPWEGARAVVTLTAMESAGMVTPRP